jgi:drug/metabolite transporter (DMT)-like permease
VAGGAMLFATKGLIAKWLYARGVGFEALVMVRAALAVPLFWSFAARANTGSTVRAAPRAALAAAAFAGFLCYYAGALTDFWALTMIDASIERILLFSYPAMVVIISSVLNRTWPSTVIVTAVAITYVGIFFAVGGFEQHVFSENLFGAALVMFSGLTYAIYFLIGARYTQTLGSSGFTVVGMTASAVALCIHFALLEPASQLFTYDGPTWLGLALLATLCMFVPALMQAEGIKRIGAQRASVASTAGPPTTILLAALFLGERLTLGQLAGVACIVGGILYLDLARAKRAKA